MIITRFGMTGHSADYAKPVTQLIDSKNVRYVLKYRNPTKVPQCQPIEDFFKYLRQLVPRMAGELKTLTNSSATS